MSKFMTRLTVTIYMLPNISRSKSNKAIKFGQLNRIEQQKYFSPKIGWKTSHGDQCQTSICFFEKALYEVKVSDLQLNFNINRQPSTRRTVKDCIKLYRDMVNFEYLAKGLGIVSPPHFVYVFSKKLFLMLYSIK